MENKFPDVISSADCMATNFTRLTAREKEMVRRWRNAADIRRWMYATHAISPEEHARFIRGLKRDRRNLNFLVKGPAGYAGVIALNRIDHANGNAYLGIYANPESRVPGKGKLLIGMLDRIAFRELRLHTLKLEVIATNDVALRFYRKAGFRREGLLREFVRRDGGRIDVIVMGKCREDAHAD